MIWLIEIGGRVRMKRYREFILQAFILISIILAVFIMFVILDITVVKIYTG